MSQKVDFGVPWLSAALLTLMLAMAPEAQAQAGITVVTLPASSIVATGATLNGTVNGNGQDISATFFDYGLTVPYDHLFVNAVPFNVIAAQGQTPVSLDVGGLTCATTYHFRVTADDSDGRNTKGSDLTFTTAPCITPEAIAVPALSNWSLLGLFALIGVATWWHRRTRRND